MTRASAGDRRVLAVRRYPVKSMGGEDLAVAAMDDRGLVGDRWWAVVDAEDRLASGKTTRRFRRRDAVFDFAARTVGDTVRVVGPDAASGSAGDWVVGDPDLDAALSAAMAAEVAVRAEADVAHQDAGPVSLVGSATLAWAADRLGGDDGRHRIRVNLVVATDEPFEEEGWVDRVVGVGEVGLAIMEPIERCRMVDLAQDGVARPAEWLRGLAAERPEPVLGVYARVATTGTLHPGDPVTP